MYSNLYEILEVSQSASQEAIDANYKRLHLKHSDPASKGDEDATNQLIALREAYRTLSDVELRRKYDNKLDSQQSNLIIEETSSHSLLKILLVVSTIGACLFGYGKHQAAQEKARLEKEQIAATAKLAELEAQREQTERLAILQAEQQRLQAQAILERQQRESDYAYGKQVSRDLERAETQARQEREKEERQRTLAEKQKQNEFERQLAKERALARQMEHDRLQRSRY
ncbi:MAG: DnaJ domain [Proteobacteria bacterium]|nr:DnaJ domain [Pseudomonadota bacterium]